jgi:hypothetical protein
MNITVNRIERIVTTRPWTRRRKPGQAKVLTYEWVDDLNDESGGYFACTGTRRDMFGDATHKPDDPCTIGFGKSRIEGEGGFEGKERNGVFVVKYTFFDWLSGMSKLVCHLRVPEAL